MILLEHQNRSIYEILKNRLSGIKSGDIKISDKIEYVATDFDGVLVRIFNSTTKKKLYICICIKFFNQLVEQGANQILEREYQSMLSKDVEDSAKFRSNVTLEIDLENIPDEVDSLAEKCSLLKRNCFAAVFERFFEFQLNGNISGGAKTAIINYREDETMYVQAKDDRVTVIFSTVFKDPEDMVIGKVFMQLLTEVRKGPQVLYSHRAPPAELHGTSAQTGDNIAYITFVLFPRHFDRPETRDRTINLIHMLRNYLHYHIKCTKAHLHSRMRAKSADFLKILNRAKPDQTSLADSSANCVIINGQALEGAAAVAASSGGAGDGVNSGSSALTSSSSDLGQKKTFSGRTFRPQ